MANIKSQMKRIKTNEKARQRNKAVKSAVRTHVRRFNEAVAAGENEKAAELARVARRALDKAAGKGVIHKNNAANHKSAIASKTPTDTASKTPTNTASKSPAGTASDKPAGTASATRTKTATKTPAASKTPVA